MPLYAASVLVVGTPEESIAQPAGISGCPLKNALKTLPAATVVVAISSSHGPGTAMQIGLVPKRPSLPCHGGTIGDALHTTMPICPASRIFCAHHAAPPKWFDSFATTIPAPNARAMRIACWQQISAIHCPT